VRIVTQAVPLLYRCVEQKEVVSDLEAALLDCVLEPVHPIEEHETRAGQGIEHVAHER
jgi:hypothetical protein